MSVRGDADGMPPQEHCAVEYRARIPDWPAGDRPREKLLAQGAEALTEAELLAILLRAGARGRTALDLARELLTAHRSLRGLQGRNPAELMRVKGIGPAKAVALAAAFELGRRAEAAGSEVRPILRNPEDVARCMIPRLRERRTEAFLVLILDARNGLKMVIELSTGTLSASLVHPREVFKAAIDQMAASILVVHNHPSGEPEPSREDIEITRQLVEAGKTLGIPVHDHLIIAGDICTSMAQRGLISS